MPEQGTWRISTAYDYVDELDSPDLAWEFLRRNSEYRNDYDKLTEVVRGKDDAVSGLSRKWGLSFRDRPRPASADRQRRVDAIGRPLDADPAGAPNVDLTCTDG